MKWPITQWNIYIWKWNGKIENQIGKKYVHINIYKNYITYGIKWLR